MLGSPSKGKALREAMAEITPKHFVYQVPEGGLKQGDIVDLRADSPVLAGIGLILCGDQRAGLFLILTQSCDLVQGRIKGPIILAPTVPLTFLLNEQLRSFVKNDVLQKARVGSHKHRERMQSFLRPLLNNTDSSYFYLHEETKFSISKSSCALLRRPFSVSADHYDELRDARRLSLSGVFQAKLGWLAGNLYSRVGTPDWSDEKKNEFKSVLKATLDDLCDWVEPQKIAAFEKIVKSMDSLPEDPEEIRQIMHSATFQTPQDQMLELLRAVIGKARTDISHREDLAREIERALLADIRFERLVRSK